MTEMPYDPNAPWSRTAHMEQRLMDALAENEQLRADLAAANARAEELQRLVGKGVSKEWGVRVTNRGTGRVEYIPQPSEASARRRVERESSTGILVCRIASDWFEAEPSADAHFCNNCSGIDPDTCLYNGEKET